MIHAGTTPWTTDGFIAGTFERKHVKQGESKEIKMERAGNVTLS